MMVMMMMLLIKKNPSSLFPCFIPEISCISHLLHFSSSSASQDQNPPPESSFIKEYLISSCGFSPKKAAIASKPIASITSPSKPDSVRHFLKHHGFTDTDIRTIISGCPRILCADVSQTIEPNLQALPRLGFMEHELRKLVVCNPQALLRSSTTPRVEFWRTLFNGDMKKLLLFFTRNRSLINLDIDKNVIPKINLLKQYGLSESQIGKIIGRRSRLFGRSIASMEVLLRRVLELGFPPGSCVFVAGFGALSGVSLDLFKAKMELFKSFGWTEGEFVTALRKSPGIVNLSEKNIQEKLRFFVERAGCTPSYIAFRPKLLDLSLEKRLMPRLHVVEILKRNESVTTKLDLYSIMNYSEQTFMEKIVVRYKEVAPELHEMYVAACKAQL